MQNTISDILILIFVVARTFKITFSTNMLHFRAKFAPTLTVKASQVHSVYIAVAEMQL